MSASVGSAATLGGLTKTFIPQGSGERKPKVKVPSDCLVGSIFLACRWRLLAVSSRGGEGTPCPLSLPLCKAADPIAGPHPHDLISPNPLPKPPLQTPSSWGLGLQHMDLGDAVQPYQRFCEEAPQVSVRGCRGEEERWASPSHQPNPDVNPNSAPGRE